MLTAEHKEKIKYLNQYKYLNRDIDRKIKSLEDWRNKIFNVTGTLSDMPRNPNRVNTIEEGVTAIDEIEASINKDIDDLVNLRAEIENKIDSVKDLRLRELLKCRYLDCQTWEEIAFRNDYTWQWAYRLHEKALDKINLD
jgi:DNA repair ATPase RecN